MKYFLDTNICIYFLKGLYPPLLERLRAKIPEDMKIASIVKAELFLGAYKSNNPMMEFWLRTMRSNSEE